mmetsp:Transcript_27981/g.39787  ORF Transcript_27981/g.39787 Transcript_27981/m.39787 type:complete len:315 (+) Transcript_27981:617-1561(+)
MLTSSVFIIILNIFISVRIDGYQNGFNFKRERFQSIDNKNTLLMSTLISKGGLQGANLDSAKLKYEILQLGAALDRGQAYNPTSGDYYAGKMAFAKNKIGSLVNLASTSGQNQAVETLQDIEGEWELVLTTVPHGIFRSSPFFLAIQEAYAIVGAPEKAELFFKLHELQTCSWGISKVGRVAQVINATEGTLISEFDTSIFSLTTIPILGWFKLLPTFGGRVVTVSKAQIKDNKILLEVDYTTSKPVEGLQGVGEVIWGWKVPVGAIWKLLPWNKGRAATASIAIKYSDADFRVMEDSDGELFVYTRPVYVEPL